MAEHRMRRLRIKVKDRQCAFNVTLVPFGATIGAVEKQKNITYSKSVFVAGVIQHKMRTRHIVIGALPSSTKFFHIIS